MKLLTSSIRWFFPVQTRFKVISIPLKCRKYYQLNFLQDNDLYGHVNNTVYHSYFDTAINVYLIKHGGMNISMNETNLLGYYVQTNCFYRAPIEFPNQYLVGLKIKKMGRSSVTYHASLFPHNNFVIGGKGYNEGEFVTEGQHKSLELSKSLCDGVYTHVFVDPKTGKPSSLPGDFRSALIKLM